MFDIFICQILDKATFILRTLNYSIKYFARLWEAAKKVVFFISGPATKRTFFELEGEGVRALVVGPLKKELFCGFP